MSNPSYCPFVVGQHVVCVDDDFGVHTRAAAGRFGCAFPVAGVVYTVREVLIFPDNGNPAIRLAEIINPILTAQWWPTGPVRTMEPLFSARRFRPAPSIAALRDIAARAPVMEPAT